MSFFHERVQFPTGQGLFHVGMFRGNSASVSFLYDCGSTTGADARNDSIKLMRNTDFLSRPDRDVAFISHLHSDHFNGLPFLRRENRMPSTLVLPYLDNVDRLITFASNDEGSIGDASDSFVEDVIVNGVPALMQRLGVRQVFEIYGSDEPPAGLRDAPATETLFPDESEAAGAIFPQPGRGGLSLNAGRVALSHSVPFIVSSGNARQQGNGRVWLLKPHVYHATEDARAEFLKSLESRLPTATLGGQSVENWITDSSNRMTLIKDYKDELRAAYGGTEKLNVTSMSLYSGPRDHEQIFRHHLSGRVLLRSRAGGWLGTGDAELIGTTLDSFLTHYSDVIHTIATLTSPHHGSEKNSDNRLYREVSPDQVIVSASPHSTHKHPDRSVVHAIGNSGAQLIVVNESPASLFHERLFLIF